MYSSYIASSLHVALRCSCSLWRSGFGIWRVSRSARTRWSLWAVWWSACILSGVCSRTSSVAAAATTQARSVWGTESSRSSNPNSSIRFGEHQQPPQPQRCFGLENTYDLWFAHQCYIINRIAGDISLTLLFYYSLGTGHRHRHRSALHLHIQYSYVQFSLALCNTTQFKTLSTPSLRFVSCSSSLVASSLFFCFLFLFFVFYSYNSIYSVIRQFRNCRLRIGCAVYTSYVTCVIRYVTTTIWFISCRSIAFIRWPALYRAKIPSNNVYCTL